MIHKPESGSGDEIVSPCVSVCRLHPETQYCLGCWRSPKEIRAWPTADKEERLAILECLHERRRAAGVTSPRDARPRRRRRTAAPTAP
ncbi:MAG: DUF1289 domain-containing protein [Rhodospirillales bacterium]